MPNHGGRLTVGRLPRQTGGAATREGAAETTRLS